MKTIKSLIANVLFLLISVVGMADSGPPPPLENGAPPAPGLPIDGGLIILVVLGLIYGVYKVVSSRKVLKA
jgi:hypothetical protein